MQDIEKIKKAIAESESIAQTLKTLGLKIGGANYKTIHLFVKEHGIDISHWKGQAIWKGKQLPCNLSNTIPLEKILVQDSTYTSTYNLKRRLINDGKLENRCYLCGSKPEWRGERLVMVLDHINGEHLDHRIENLRLLCPNCNSQQPTFAGRNRKKP